MFLKTLVKKSKVLRSAYNRFEKCLFETATRISPKLNTAMRYRQSFHKKWNINNPCTLNDKVLWLKFNTYWNNSLVKKCADKYKVREYIESIGCGELLNEIIAVYENVEDIDWDNLPKSFALKLNTGCGYNIVVSDKAELDIQEAKEKLRKWMKEEYYLAYSEMQYKDVKKYILVEKYIKPRSGVLPDDYKFYCFNGTAPYVMVCTDRQIGGKHPKFWYYNRDWELQMMTADALKYGEDAAVAKPEGMDAAFEYAEKLSKGFPFVRVDLYIVDGKPIFGEMTFTPSGGLDSGRLESTDILLGSLVQLDS